METKKKCGFFARLFYKLWKKIDKDDVLTEVEQLAFDIFSICLYNDDNIRYLCSNSSDKKYIVTKSYIINNDIKTFIIFEFNSNRITIVNHEFRYDILLPNKTCTIMNNMFNDKVEKDREKMEKEILNNITQSLDIVLKQFKNELEKDNQTI